MLTLEQARHIANTWRPRFPDPEAFVTSWSRYMDMVKRDRSPTGLESWLRADAEQDEVRSAGLPSEPLLPTRQRHQLNDCRHCEGKRYVRQDVDIDHPNFGKAQPCPRCNT